MTTPGFTPLSGTPTAYRPTTPAPHPGDTAHGVVDLKRPVDPQVYVTPYSRPLPAYEETFAGPGYESRPLPASPFAVAALVCGIVGVFLLIPALGAIVLGHLGLRQTSRNTHTGRGLATGGLVLGYAVATVVALVVLAVWISEL